MAQQRGWRFTSYNEPQWVPYRSFGLFLILLLLSVPVFMAQGREFSQFAHQGSSVSSAANGKQDIRVLEPGVPVERELAGGRVHSYRITLTSGQYCRVVVDQRGIDVVVRLFGPDSKQIAEVDSPNGTQGPEPLSVVAEASGDYRLEVTALEKDAAVGRYEVKIEEVREATPQDSTRIAAEKVFLAGERLRAQGTAESLRKAIESYLEALPLWQASGDRSGEADTLNSIGNIHAALGKNQESLHYLNQSLHIFRTIGNPKGEANTLTNIGSVYAALGDNTKALDYFTQALPISRAASDREGEATILHNLGQDLRSQGESPIVL
jgi:hypothetical protein